MNGILSSIGERTFYDCCFEGILFPKTLTSLGEHCLGYNKKLKNVTFAPDIKLTRFANFFLFSTDSLERFVIPKSVTFFGACFEGAVGMLEYIVEEGNPSFYSLGGAIYSLTNKTFYFFPAKVTGTFKIPINVTSIYERAFMYSKLSEIVLPPTVTSISYMTFQSSTIVHINLPDGLQSIGSSAFSSCSKLESISIPETVTTIGATCFINCKSLKTVYLPSSLVEFGGGVFIGCNEDIHIEFAPGSDYIIDSKTFMITNKDITSLCMYIGSQATVKIPRTIEEILANAFSQASTIEKFEFEDGCPFLTLIEQQAFYYCSSLKSITLPKSVKEIKGRAFQSCRKLEEITIGSSIEFIDNYCFLNCESLTKITIQGSNYEVGDYVFMNLKSLTEVQFSDGLTEIGNNCFQGCVKLTEITLPKSLSFIGNYSFAESGIQTIHFSSQSEIELISDFTFYQCNNLSSIELPSSIAGIMQYSFAYSSISTISIPPSVYTLDTYCFRGCKYLTTFIIPSDSDLKEISYGVFYECMNLEVIKCNASNFVVENGALYDKDRTQFFVLPPKSPAKFFSFPETLHTIKPYALYGCYS